MASGRWQASESESVRDPEPVFYGWEQARIHDQHFGHLARHAAADLLALLRAGGFRDGTVVDLGCGSGILARAVGDAGYHVVGVDFSPDMVALALERAPQAELLVASLHDFDLPSGCVAVAATGEALNYGADPAAGLEALARVAGRVFEALAPGGWWLFDVSGPGRAGPGGVTKQFFRQPGWCLGMTATETASDGSAEARLDREITVFAAEGEGEGGGSGSGGDQRRYRRIEEHHVLQLYRREDVVSQVTATGFWVSVLDDYRSAPARPPLAGWYVVEAQKPS